MACGGQWIIRRTTHELKNFHRPDAFGQSIID
jgi:hypothetical protein